MSLKKAIQDLINHSKQHQEGPVSEKLPSCRECYPLRRTKKAYEALVREVLSAEDAPTEQKDIAKIIALAKLVVLSIEYTYELNYRATDIAYGIVAIIKKTYNYGNDQSPVNAYYQAL